MTATAARRVKVMISVIIPTLNGGPGLVHLLSALQSQTVDTEVVVIDSGSTDGTDEVVLARGISLIRIARESFNHGASRNHAARIAAGSILVFMTQDCLPAQAGCIRTLTECLFEPQIAAAYGRHICRGDARPPERFSREHNYPPDMASIHSDRQRSGTIRDCFFSNVFSAIRRKEFEELGGFPENVIMFEDMLFAARLLSNGYSIAYIPEAQVIHSHNLTPKQTLKRYFQAGMSFRKNPWFLDHAASGGEGLRFVRAQAKYLIAKRECVWLPYALWENVCKFAGYRLGLRYDRLPPWFVKRMAKV